MNPLQNDFWQKVTPATPVGKRRAFIVIPAFSLDTVWQGVNTINHVYNYTTTNNFTFVAPEMPEDANFIACIKYRMEDGTVFRYKLWALDGDQVFFPLYEGQLIRKNFQIEIWNTDDTPLVLSEDITLTLSFFTARTSLTEDATYDAATGTEVTDLLSEFVEPTPLVTTDAIFRWTSEGGSEVGTTSGLVDTWTDILNSHVFTGSNPDKPTYNSSVPEIADNYSIGIDNDGDFLFSDNITEDLLHVFMVCRVKNTNIDDANILSGTSRVYFTTSFSTANDFQITTVSAGDGVSFEVPAGEYTDWMILEMLIDGGTNETYVRFTDFKGNTQTVTSEFASDIFNAGELVLGFIPAAGGVFDVAEVLGYDALQIGANHTAVIDYFKRVYGGMALPLDYTTDQHGIEN